MMKEKVLLGIMLLLIFGLLTGCSGIKQADLGAANAAENAVQPQLTTLQSQLWASTYKGVAPLWVQFADVSTGSITNWSWDFGDGNTSNHQNPFNIFASAGVYTVTLQVSGPMGNDTFTDQINVTSSPTHLPDFSLSHGTVGDGLTWYWINWKLGAGTSGWYESSMAAYYFQYAWAQTDSFYGPYDSGATG